VSRQSSNRCCDYQCGRTKNWGAGQYEIVDRLGATTMNRISSDSREADLQENGHSMHEMLGDAVPLGLVEVDSNDLIVDANTLLAEWSGLELAALIGQQLYSIVRPPQQSGPAAVEYLPAIAEIFHSGGSIRSVLVAEGAPRADGHRYVTLFNADEQRTFRERLQARLALAQRAQTRLELVIDASIAFAEASTEVELAEVLAATTARAYAAEESVVFLLDEEMVFRQVAGTNPFGGLEDAATLAVRATELRTVMKISGVKAAYATAESVGAAFEAAGVQSMIIAPIRQRNQPIGILAAFFHHPRQFDEQASPLADALAGQAARAVTGLRLQQRLEHAALHDDTTGLPNRRLLEERIEGSRRSGNTVLGVLFVDLDGFKNVNDQLGHQIGDEVLREVAARLQSTVREQDVVARYGGDEFVIVCEVSSESAATEMAERVLESIRAPYRVLPDGLTIGASIGVSVAPPSTSIRTDRLVRAADQAMYQAKYAGGGQIVSATV
jgi:diguanylate cyclase (GGDEF)-like protein